MKLQLLLLAACLCAVSAHIPKKLLKKYAMKKVMESCFGKDLMDSVKQEIYAACDKCHGEKGPEMPQLRNQLTTMFGGAPVLQPAGGYRAVQYVPVPAAVQYQPITYQYQRRWKRSHHHKKFSPEKLEMMQMKIRSIVGNMTCVLKEMKMLTADHQVDYASIEQRINSMPVSAELQEDLKESMAACRDFSTCIPSSVFEKSPIMAGHGKQIAFFKCFKAAKIESCMKQEFRNEYYPMLLRDGLAMDEDESFSTIITSAMLEEAGDM